MGTPDRPSRTTEAKGYVYVIMLVGSGTKHKRIPFLMNIFALTSHITTGFLVEKASGQILLVVASQALAYHHLKDVQLLLLLVQQKIVRILGS